jgi:hypothetical protein
MNFRVAIHKRKPPSLSIVQRARPVIKLSIAWDIKRRPTNARRLRIKEREDIRRLRNIAAQPVKPKPLRRQKMRHVSI